MAMKLILKTILNKLKMTTKAKKTNTKIFLKKRKNKI